MRPDEVWLKFQNSWIFALCKGDFRSSRVKSKFKEVNSIFEVYPCSIAHLQTPSIPIAWLYHLYLLISRNCSNDFFYWSNKVCKWTNINVLHFRSAMSETPMTVLPKAVGTDNIPFSCWRRVVVANCCSFRRVPIKQTSICFPPGQPHQNCIYLG